MDQLWDSSASVAGSKVRFVSAYNIQKARYEGQSQPCYSWNFLLGVAQTTPKVPCPLSDSFVLCLPALRTNRCLCQWLASADVGQSRNHYTNGDTLSTKCCGVVAPSPTLLQQQRFEVNTIGRLLLSVVYHFPHPRIATPCVMHLHRPSHRRPPSHPRRSSLLCPRPRTHRRQNHQR